MKLDPELDIVLTPKEVALILKVPYSTVLKLARQGRIPAFKIGRQWRFSRLALRDWVASQKELTDDRENDAA